MPKLVLAAVLALALAPALPAAPVWKWATSLDTVVGTGDTRYLMEELGSPGVSSELIFPLNTLVEGVTFRGERAGGRRDWGFEASVAVNLFAPFGKMKDYDWWMYPGYPKMAFSYTESDANMVWLTASVAWKPMLVTRGWGSLAAVLGYRLQYVHQEALDFKGWVYEDITSPPDTDPEPPNVPDGVPEPWLLDGSGIGTVLTYWVLWNIPTAGLAVTLRPGAAVTVQAEAGLAVPIVADEDDHVLRYKLSTASGMGFGAYAELAARYSWGKSQSRVRPFLSLSVGGMALKANTQQTQTWYGDDPGTLGDDTGFRILGVDHQISTRQFSVVLACGATY
jgi:hypothetical protein